MAKKKRGRFVGGCSCRSWSSAHVYGVSGDSLNGITDWIRTNKQISMGPCETRRDGGVCRTRGSASHGEDWRFAREVAAQATCI